MKVKCSEVNISSLDVICDLLITEGILHLDDVAGNDPNWRENLQSQIGTTIAIHDELVRAGYQLVLEEASHRFSVKEQKRFVLSSKSAKNLQSKKVKKMSQAQQMVLYPMLGLAKETLKDIYGIGRDLLHQERYADATRVFTYLIWLHPLVSWFWLELGKSWEKQDELTLALYAYGVAINEAPTVPELYRYAAHACIKIGDLQRAKAIITYGIDSCRIAEWSHDIMQHLNELEAMLLAVEKLETK
jgi:tetratricopeptide (TPR) repeat protein